MTDKKMKILIVEPMKRPKVREIDGSLESMQAVVGGTIQAVYPFEDEVALICNDEGKMIGLSPNRFLRDEAGEPYDLIHGTFFLAGLGEENFTSLTKEQIEKYSQKYAGEMCLCIPAKKKNTIEMER